jgi:acetyltransferase-like isoleucine patch superfamily enzyme
VSIGPGVVTERRPDAVRVWAEAGAHIEIGAGTWLRTDLGPVVLAAWAGARLQIGPDCFLNGCHLSAKQSLELGRRVFVGPGTRVFDADQHDLDADTPERAEAVVIGDHTWIAADATVLRGTRIGQHSVVGARSLVTRDLPPHSLAYGQPARPHGAVGDRSGAR